MYLSLSEIHLQLFLYRIVSGGMFYLHSTSSSWLSEEKYRDKQQVQIVLNLGNSETDALLNFHNHFSLRSDMKPSDGDMLTLRKMYSEGTYVCVIVQQ